MRRDVYLRHSLQTTVGVLAFLICLGAGHVLPAYPAGFTIYDDDMALRGDNFQSHNQKIVWTENGLFRSGDLQSWPNGSDNVVIQRSTDGGVSWQNIYDTGVHRNDLKPPTIEADPAGNVYIIYPRGGNTRFVKFSASNNYSSAVVTKETSLASSASKFASAYDAGRNRLYHGTQWGRLLTYDTSGNVTGNKHLVGDGGDSRPSYPHVMVDEFGVIHYAMTVADGGDDVPYTDIRYMKSLDGGQTWKAMDGTTISTPTGAAGASSGATLINRSGEHNYATWLANMHVKDGKVHFTYQTDNPWDPAGAGNPPPITPYMNYMRFDEATGVREIDRTDFSGGGLSINADAASFASDMANPTGALYVLGISSDSHRLRALVSYDNGENWQDCAQSGWYSLIANPGMARTATPDGKIVGAVASSSPYWATVNHVELPTAQPTTTIAYWDGGGSNSAWGTDANWVGDAEPGFNNKLAVAIGSNASTAQFDTMRIENNLTVRALIFGTYADADVSLRLNDSWSNGRTLTFASNVPGGSAEINVHHDATGSIDIGGAYSDGNVVLDDPLRVKHNGSGMLTISRPISGSHGITKTGDGEFRLSGDNSYTGGTTLTGGVTRISGDAALGAVPGSPGVNVTLDGGGIKNNDSTPVIHANRTILLGAAGGWFTSGWGKPTTINGRVTGVGSLTVNNDWGQVILANTANDYAGDTIIGGELTGFYENSATLRLGASEVLPHGSGKGTVVFNASAGGTATLDLNGRSETVNMLSATGDGTARVIGAGTLTVGADNAGGTFSGSLEGSLAFAKIGTGTLALAGSDIAYAGPTTVEEGLLKLSDATAFASALTNDAEVEFEATAGNWTFEEALGGAGTFTKSGDGTLVIAGLQDYDPGALFEILAGTVEMNTDASGTGLMDDTDLSILVADATLDFGCNQHLDTLEIADGGFVRLTGANVVVVKNLVMNGIPLGETTLTPEPATLALLAMGGLALLGFRRRAK